MSGNPASNGANADQIRKAFETARAEPALAGGFDLHELADRSLFDLAQQINRATAAAECSARAAVLHALEAGRLLTAAKDQVQHGEFEAWIRSNTTVAPRTARAYMSLAKRLPALPQAERQRVAEMPLRAAINAIGTAAAPPQSPPRYRPSNAVAAALRPGLLSAARSLSNLASDVGLKSIKVERIKALRTKLNAALSALDSIEGKTSLARTTGTSRGGSTAESRMRIRRDGRAAR